MNEIEKEIAIRKRFEALEERIEALENQKTGHWIPKHEKEEIYAEMFICSNCGYSDFMATYCPHCGAKMKGEQK